MKPSDIQGLLAKSYEKKLSDFGDFQVDKSLSGGKVQVYYNPKTGQAVVVHRGSDGSKDWLVNDTGLLVGYRGKRFRHAQEIQDKAEEKYGAANVTTLGHSLGAKIAEEVGKKSKEVITLNKPTVDTKKVSDKQFDIRASTDIVSGFSGIASSNNKTTIPSGFRDFISEHSTDVLSRLPDEPIGRGGRAPRRSPSPNRATITRAQLQAERELEDELIRLGVRFQQMLNGPRENYIPLLTGMVNDYRQLNQIHGGLDDILETFETALANEQRLVALREEEELQGGMMGGANIQEMYQQLIDTHADIQLEEDLYDYRDRLEYLIEKFYRYVETLDDAGARPFNVLLDAYEAEFQDILEEIEAQEESSEEDEDGNKENIKPSNTGGRINPPREPKVFSTYTAEEIEAMELARQAREIQRAEEARMRAAFPRHGLLAIQNPADMERRAIRPRNIGAPRGGASRAGVIDEPVIVMYRQLLDTHEDIQYEENLSDRRDRLFDLLEVFNTYTQSLDDEDAEPFNELLDEYEDEYQGILMGIQDEIAQQYFNEARRQEEEQRRIEDEYGEANKENRPPSNIPDSDDDEGPRGLDFSGFGRGGGECGCNCPYCCCGDFNFLHGL